jgi:hypothetical protein
VRRRRLGSTVLAGLICVLVASLLILGYLAFRPVGSGGTVAAQAATGRPATDPSAELMAWTVRNLPGDTRLLTDAGTRDVLVARGYPSAQLVVLDDSTDHSDAQLVIETAGVRRLADQPRSAADTLLRRALAGAVPMAIFGTGPDRIVVSQLGGRRFELLDAPRRLAAGRALVRDARLTLAPPTASAVLDGRLDLRAAHLLSTLASGHRTELLALEQDPAERLAGTPIRVIDIQVTGNFDLQWLSRALAGLPNELRPAQFTQQDGGCQLVWLPDRAASAPVG